MRGSRRLAIAPAPEIEDGELPDEIRAEPAVLGPVHVLWLADPEQTKTRMALEFFTKGLAGA